MNTPHTSQKLKDYDAGLTNAYKRFGVEGYYREHAGSYRNPHTSQVTALVQEFAPLIDLSRVLDLACGSGEVTLALPHPRFVEGCDPFTKALYEARTGAACLPLSFEQIALQGFPKRYSVVVCSYALHLCPKSVLPTLIYRLAQVAPKLLVITPIKRPEIKRDWGWELEKEIVRDRVRGRLYRGGWGTTVPHPQNELTSSCERGG